MTNLFTVSWQAASRICCIACRKAGNDSVAAIETGGIIFLFRAPVSRGTVAGFSQGALAGFGTFVPVGNKL